MQRLNDDDIIAIQNMRLLICRAAQKDSLSWWEDDSLTHAGNYLVERTFLFNPTEAAVKMALQAGFSRYDAAFRTNPEFLHLFRLDLNGEIEMQMKTGKLPMDEVISEPIRSIDELKERLSNLGGYTSEFKVISERSDRRLEIQVSDEHARSNPLKLAQIFASASLAGKPEQPIFPYLMVHDD